MDMIDSLLLSYLLIISCEMSEEDSMPNIGDDRVEDVHLVNVTQVGEKCLHQLRRGHLRLVLLERVRPGGGHPLWDDDQLWTLTGVFCVTYQWCGRWSAPP